MTKTPDKIKKGLAEAIEETSWVVEGGDAHDLQDACDMAHASMADALALIEKLEADNNQLKYTLMGVMHFIDKWIDISPYDVEKDHHGDVAVNRAALARKIALEAIEQLEAENTRKHEKIMQLYNALEEETKIVQDVAEYSKKVFQNLESQKTELLEKVEQLTVERDALMCWAKGRCDTCAYKSDCAKHDCNSDGYCSHWYDDCEDWQWRGVQKEE